MMQKITNLFQILKEGYKVYIATQPAIVKELTISEELKPYVQFFDCLLAENRDWYKNKITELNIRVFGSLAMPTEAWIDHHFGIACGVTIGFLDLAGEPISMARFCRHFDENSIHEWTLMVEPKYEGVGFGKATLALACELSKNKEKISYTTQLNNPAMALYLHLINEGGILELLGIGFHHTHLNSILAIVKIPNDSNSIMKKYEMPSIDNGILVSEKTDLVKGQKYLIQSNNINVIKMISKDLKNGARYSIIGWYPDSEKLGVKEPLTLIEKLE